MQYISLALNMAFAVFLVLGFLVGLKRGMKRTLVRSIWLAIVVVALIFISTRITSAILNINFNLFYNGQACSSLKDYFIKMLESNIAVEGADYAGIVELIFALITMVANVIIFFVLYWILKLLTLPLYWIVNIFIFKGERRKKKRAKKEKQKIKIKKHRLAGALIGVVIGFLSFCITLTPVMGYVNIAKSVEKETVDEEGNGVLTDTFGDTYTQVMDEYNKSIPMKVISTTKIDVIINAVYNELTSTKINGTKVTLKDEALVGAKFYNTIRDYEVPDLNTMTKSELDELITKTNTLIDIAFEMKLVTSSWDVVVPFAVKYARTTIDTSEFKPYVLQFYNAVFDEMEGFNSTTTKGDLKAVLALVKVLNDSDLLLPIIQDSEIDHLQHLQSKLTSQVANDIVEKLFAINTVNNLAPAVVNLLLGYGSEKLEYEYSTENSVESNVLKESASTILDSVVDILGTYNADSTTKVEINRNTIGAFAGILDELKVILSDQNFKNVINSLETKLDDMAKEILESQAKYLNNLATNIIENISDIDNYETTFVELYDCYDEIKTQLNEAKVGDNYDVQLMNFNKLGKVFDTIEDNALLKNNLFIDTMHDAVEQYLQDFEKTFSTESETFEFTFDDVLLNNINGIKTTPVKWEDEFPKYKNTVGIFVNLFKNNAEISVVDKLKNDSDTSLEDLGQELDTNLKDSTLFKGADRLLVADLLTIAEINFNTTENDDLTTMLSSAKANVLDEDNDLTWKHELKHLKSLISIELNDTSDAGMLTIAETLDSVVFDTESGGEVVPASKIFTKEIINTYIVSYMDDMFGNVATTNDFYDTLNSIKTAFTTKNINSYSNEIEAMLIIKNIKENIDGEIDFKSNASAIGADIDSALNVGVVNGNDPKVVVTRSLINDYFKKYIADPSNIGISGSFSEVIEPIIGSSSVVDGKTVYSEGRIDTMTSSYSDEFGYLAQLMYVSEAFGEVTIDSINTEKSVNGINSTLAEQFDGNSTKGIKGIRDSQLIGDSLINVFTEVFDEFLSDNIKTGDDDYNAILDEVKYNYNGETGVVLGIKDDIIWVNNENIDWDNVGQHTTYTQLINSIDDINGYVVDETSDNYIAGDLTLVSLKDSTLATKYDNALNTLQNGVLMSSNATNKLMQYILLKVEDIVSATTLTKAYVEGYQTFLSGKVQLTTSGVMKTYDVKWVGLPYNDTDAIYAYVVDSVNNIWAVENDNTHSGIQLNMPFTIINTLIISETA